MLLKSFRPTAVLFSSDNCRTIIKQASDDYYLVTEILSFRKARNKILLKSKLFHTYPHLLKSQPPPPFFNPSKPVLHRPLRLFRHFYSIFSPKSFCNLQVNCIFVYNFGVVMTEEEKKLLSTFEARLRHLIYLHDELKRENAELKQLLEDEKSELEKARAEYKALESSYTDLKTATTISLNGSDVKETKLRLSKLVREVDKCIALLNE